jgi:hypothetical protein
MLLPWLMRLIETHAEQMTEKLIQVVRANPRTSFLHEVSEPELRRRVFDLYHNLGRWLGEKSEVEIEATYRDLGSQRCREGVPLHELVYALVLVKHQLWDYIQSNDLPETATNLYGEGLLDVMVGKFFDTAVYHAVKGYEETWAKEASLRLLAGTPSGSGTTPATIGIARAVLGELEARRGVLDNDPALRSVSLAVKLDSSGQVCSVTVRQESETERPRR